MNLDLTLSAQPARTEALLWKSHRWRAVTSAASSYLSLLLIFASSSSHSVFTCCSSPLFLPSLYFVPPLLCPFSLSSLSFSPSMLFLFSSCLLLSSRFSLLFSGCFPPPHPSCFSASPPCYCCSLSHPPLRQLSCFPSAFKCLVIHHPSIHSCLSVCRLASPPPPLCSEFAPSLLLLLLLRVSCPAILLPPETPERRDLNFPRCPALFFPLLLTVHV